MARPPKIVLKSDEEKRFGDAVKAGIETLAKELSVPMFVGIGLTKAYFLDKGKVQSKVTLADFESAVAEIKAMFKKQTEEKIKASNDGQLPLTDGSDAAVLNKHGKPDNSQAMWDLGRWKGMLTIHGLSAKYAGEIMAGKKLTEEQLDGYAAELKVEKARIAELVDEKADPDPIVAGKTMPCAASRHYGDNEPVELTQRFLLERGDDGKLRRKQHGKGAGGDIVAGELLRADTENFSATDLPLGVVKIEEGGNIFFGVRYCSPCRQAALEDFRARKDLPKTDPNWVDRRSVLTFYTVGGLRLIAKRESESSGRISQARDLEGAGARTFGGSYGTAKNKRDWHVTRGKR